MKIASIQKFHFDGTPVIIRYNANEVGDTSTPETYFEVTNFPEEGELNAIGYSLNSSDGVVMKFANISGLDTSESITKDGLYLILSGALERLELSGTAECDVIVKQVI